MSDPFDDGSISSMMIQFPYKLRRFIIGLSSTYLEDTDIKPRHMKYLALISMYDGISQKDLAERTFVDKSSVSYMIKELTDKGLVYNSGSGKSSCLHLTESGKRAAVIGRTIRDLMDEKIFGGLPAEERDALVSIVGKVIARIDELNEEYGSKCDDS